MNCKIYYPVEWMYNDATAFYIDIMAEAMEQKGYAVMHVKSPSEITQEDTVIIVSAVDVRAVLPRNPKKIICWFQGIAPEEKYYFSHDRSLGKMARIRCFLVQSFFEWYALRHCDFNFFVSNAMQNYYRRKYCYRKNNWFIMPCFNQLLNLKAFTTEKYAKPSFVYAGSLDGWQCFDKTLEIYQLISNRVQGCSLTILTGAQDQAREILKRYDIEAEVKYVTRDKIDEELSKYKYGFIIRQDNPVNNVATPTKMNSYLANGIIPVFTDVISAFKENLGDLKYSIPLTMENVGLEKLLNLEANGLSVDEVKSEYQKTFETFYSRDYYLKQLAKIDF